MPARIEDAERQGPTTASPASLHAYGLALNAQSLLLNFTAADTALARD